MVIEVTCSEVVPLLVSVTLLGRLLLPTFVVGKLILVGETMRKVPVPERLAVCEPPGALSFTVRVPVRVPEVVGLNVTRMAQLAPTAKVGEQLVVFVKSPLIEILEMVSVDVL